MLKFVGMGNANGPMIRMEKYGTKETLLISKQISGKDSIRYGCLLALV